MFQDLEDTLIEIKNELKLYRELFALQLDNLKTRQQVARFLKVNQKTIYNWVKDGTLREGEHFIICDNNKREYIPEAIIKFSKDLKIRKTEVVKVEKQLNPISKKFLNKRQFVNG